MIKQAFLPALLLTVTLFGHVYCSPKSHSHRSIHSIASFREIPGVTDEEIAAIEKLKSLRESFSYGALLSTESFIDADGAYAGFTAAFCELLSGLFGVPFVQNINSRDVLESAIDNLSIDFTGDLTPTADRQRLNYFMTYPIAQRSLTVFTYVDSLRPKSHFDLNGLRIGFLKGTITSKALLAAYPSLNFEIVDAVITADVFGMFEAGEIDAFIADAVEAIAFADYPDIRAAEITPLVYTPISLTTRNPELQPIISVVNKYIAAGGITKLHELYKAGHYEYIKYRLDKSFTDEERAYLAALTKYVPIGLGFDAYPIFFYDEKIKKYQGIAVDVLAEITKFIGIEFKIVNDTSVPLVEIFEQLTIDEATFISELSKTEERQKHFLWSNKPYFSSPYAFISKSIYPNLEPYQTEQVIVGILRGSSYEETYKAWFPSSNNFRLFASIDEALNALERDEINLIFTSEYTLLYQMNYREKPGYKINYSFPVYTGSFFGFNKNEAVLQSIVDKAMIFIDTDKISKDWTGRIYDYSRTMVQQRSLFFRIFADALLLVAALLTILYLQNIRKKKTIAGMARELKSALEIANAASRAKSDFLATMSHEIRTPMNAIIGITQMQLQKENLPDDYVNSLEKIRTAGNNLLGIVNDILDLLKVETGKMELYPADYCLPSLINDTMQLNFMRVDSKPINFILDVDETLPAQLHGDELRLKQILNNLLSNAIKYTDAGHVKLSVKHTPVGEDVRLKFIVEDTGHGMKPEDKARLFQKEYKRFNINTNRYTEGIGLGLSITKSLVNLMNGKIEVESEYNQGCVFTVEIIQKNVSDKTIGTEISDKLKHFTSSTARFKKKKQHVREIMPYGKVLVVDDIETNLLVAEGLLLPYKLNIETALSGFEAIDKVKAGNAYNIIFMDHMMPKMDGIETTQKIRDLGYEGTIIALTANALAGNEEMFLLHGFDGFISKPVDTRRMNAMLNMYIRDKHPEEAKKYEPEANTEATLAINPKIIKVFRGDAQKSAAALREALASGDIKLFTITAHGMKTALLNVGENELSAIAAKLEDAGLTDNMGYISANTEKFVSSLEALIQNLSSEEVDGRNNTNTVGTADVQEDTDYLTMHLQIIKDACENYNNKAAYAAFDLLKEKSWKKETADTLEKIRNMLYLHSDFDGAAEAVKEFFCAHH